MKSDVKRANKLMQEIWGKATEWRDIIRKLSHEEKLKVGGMVLGTIWGEDGKEGTMSFGHHAFQHYLARLLLGRIEASIRKGLKRRRSW